MGMFEWVIVGVVCALCVFGLLCVVQDALLRRAARKEAERRAAHEKLMQDEKEYWAKERAKSTRKILVQKGYLTEQSAVAAMQKNQNEVPLSAMKNRSDKPCSMCKAEQHEDHAGWCSNVNPLSRAVD